MNISIEFPNKKAADLFVSWLFGAGEQDYWEWAECNDPDNKVEFKPPKSNTIKTELMGK